MKPVLCLCGDERGAHAHYRGDAEVMFAECALCHCGRFRRPWWWRAGAVLLRIAAVAAAVAVVLTAGAWALHGVAVLFRAIP